MQHTSMATLCSGSRALQSSAFVAPPHAVLPARTATASTVNQCSRHAAFGSPTAAGAKQQTFSNRQHSHSSHQTNTTRAAAQNGAAEVCRQRFLESGQWSVATRVSDVCIVAVMLCLHQTSLQKRKPRKLLQATTSAEGEVLAALSRIIDPDFGEDIVACGFVRDLVTGEHHVCSHCSF